MQYYSTSCTYLNVRFASISPLLCVFLLLNWLDLIVARCHVAVAVAVTQLDMCKCVCVCARVYATFFNTIGLRNIIIFVIYISAYSVVCYLLMLLPLLLLLFSPLQVFQML